MKANIEKLVLNSKYLKIEKRKQGKIKYIDYNLNIGYKSIKGTICYNSATGKYAGLLNIYEAQHREVIRQPKYEDMSLYQRDKAIKEQQQQNNAYKISLYNRGV